MVKAQESAIKVSTKNNDNRSVSLEYEKAAPGTFTMVVNFKQLTNTTSGSQQTFTISGYSGSFVTLNPSNKDQGVGVSYSYSYIRGKLKPRYNPNFVYLLPYRTGAVLRAAEVGFVGSAYFGNSTPDDWKVYRFYTKDQDTVTAVRKGMVVDVKDLYNTELNAGAAYTSRTNEVIIEHEDGTLATYRGFQKGSFMVKVGQTIFPATALGLNAKSGSNDAYNISLMLTYLKSADIESTRGQNLQTSKSLYGFITPHFYTTENADIVLENNKSYNSAKRPEIVQLELSKREIKSLGIK